MLAILRTFMASGLERSVVACSMVKEFFRAPTVVGAGVLCAGLPVQFVWLFCQGASATLSVRHPPPGEAAPGHVPFGDEAVLRLFQRLLVRSRRSAMACGLVVAVECASSRSPLQLSELGPL